MFAGDRDVQQSAPEGRQPGGVRTIDRDSGQAVRHVRILHRAPLLACLSLDQRHAWNNPLFCRVPRARSSMM
jgi:hypothetical protein